MLKFIRNLLLKKEAPEEKISIDELDSWLDIKAKPIFDDLNGRVNEIIEKINNEKNTANENRDILKNARLQNPKIPERVKAIMQGNREGLIKRVSLFFNSIDLKYDYYEELAEKCRNIEKEIDLLGKGTAKNYQILNEFFAREAEKVAMNIKNIESYCKELINTINNSKISNIDKIKSGVIDLKNKIKLKESYSIQLESSNNNLNDNKNKKIDIEKKINGLKSDHDYKNYEKLLEENKKAGLKINEIENILFHDFSVLDKALKKYAKIAFEDENSVLEYLENPMAALIEDADFRILNVLDNLKGSVQRDDLGLEEKKKDKSIGKINEMDSVYLTKIKDDFINAKKRLNYLQAEIENNNSRKNLDLLNEELKNINKSIEDINNKIMNLNSELGKINIGKLRENLQKEINDAVNVKITHL